MEVFAGTLLMLTGILLIFLILLQQGQGVLGSSFNAHSAVSVCWADGVYSRVTAAVAVAWILLAGLSVQALS